VSLFPMGTLGPHIRVLHGFAFKGEYFRSTGDWILLTPGNFFDCGGLKHKGEKEKYYDGPVPPEYVLKRGDLIVAMTDLVQAAPMLGAAAWIPQSDKYLHNQRLGLVTVTSSELSKAFLYYLFNHPDVRAQVRSTATGTTVRHTAPERLYKISAPLPPRAIQERIADILGAYDDLIENNSRRIRVLEAMARTLYCEWIEQRMGPGASGQWRECRLADLADVNSRSIRRGHEPSDILYIDISSVERGRIIAGKRYSFADAPGRARRLVKPNDIIWSQVRPNHRAHALLIAPSSDLVVSTGFAVLSPRSSPSLLYQMVTTDDFVSYLMGRARGAAMPDLLSSFAAA
jgi:type I restriction enzyme S subunit